ncbi:MAG: leucyl/phenylalanyl-tRNA--protein transferase [Chitinophagaceae bacterium]|nr:leucyl/phenylalanyl-tRNA--protein transferase [Chitinophagaceae bacterium]
MPLFALDDELIFPPVHLSMPDGLLAIGGDLSPARLLLAYRNGIFPWYEEEPILWWSPDPRLVLFPGELRISKSVKPMLKRNVFEFTINKDFSGVISACRQKARPGQDSTWITTEVQAAYIKMHELGHAHSAEVWQDGKLAGGLYGIKMGKVFFGESMFSHVSNASRYAFIRYVQQLQSEGIELIDCQVQTDYLESMGARMIPRRMFIQLLQTLIN